jgi:hypothetical protein
MLILHGPILGRPAPISFVHESSPYGLRRASVWVRPFDEPQLSDHYGVVADLRY